MSAIIMYNQCHVREDMVGQDATTFREPDVLATRRDIFSPRQTKAPRKWAIIEKNKTDFIGFWKWKLPK